MNKINKPIFICLISALFPFYAFFQMTVLNALAENLTLQFNLSHIGLSALSSAYLYGDAFMLIPAGLILDRFNTRNVILASFSLLLISSFLFCFAPSFHMAITMRFISGIAHSFALIASFKIVALYGDAKSRGLIMSLILTIAFIGGFFAQAPFVWLLHNIGFTNAVLMQTFIGLIILIMLIAYIDNPTSLINVNYQELRLLIPNLLRVAKNSQNWLAMLFIALMGMPFMLFGALYGIQYLSQAKQMSLLTASANIDLIFIGIIIGSPVVGWLFDKTQYQKTLLAVGTLLTLFSCILVFTNIKILWLVFLAIGIFSSVQVLGYPVIANNNPVDISGTAMGFSNFLIMLTLASLQLITGLLANTFTLQVGLLCMLLLSTIISATTLFGLKIKLSPK